MDFLKHMLCMLIKISLTFFFNVCDCPQSGAVERGYGVVFSFSETFFSTKNPQSHASWGQQQMNLQMASYYLTAANESTLLILFYLWNYRKVSNIKRTKSQNLNASRLIL